VTANSKEDKFPPFFYSSNLLDEALTFGAASLALMTFNLKPEMLTAKRDREKVQMNEKSNEKSFILQSFGLKCLDKAITFGAISLALMTFHLKPEMLTANRDR
jgi:hypothetical protein